MFACLQSPITDEEKIAARTSVLSAFRSISANLDGMQSVEMLTEAVKTATRYPEQISQEGRVSGRSNVVES